MTDLWSRLGLAPSACIAVVGAGGKTALCWQLVQEARQQHERVVFTTTTKIWEPANGAFDLLLTHTHPADILYALNTQPWHTACVIGQPTDRQPSAIKMHSYMPVVATKRHGLDPQTICALRQALPPATWIVEADGARNLPLKAPAEHEPVIPSCTTLVCLVANLDAVDQPLSEQIVYQADRFAQLTGLALGDRITPDAIIAELIHPNGGLKRIPPHASAVAVLTHRNLPALRPDQLGRLTQHGYAQALLWPLAADHLAE